MEKRKSHAKRFVPTMDQAWMGNLATGFVVRKERPWAHVYLQRRGECSNCWLRALCGGGCRAHAISYNGCIAQPYRLECELVEWRYRLAFWILSQVPGMRDRIRCAHQSDVGGQADSGHVVVPLWNYLGPGCAAPP